MIFNCVSKVIQEIREQNILIMYEIMYKILKHLKIESVYKDNLTVSRKIFGSRAKKRCFILIPLNFIVLLSNIFYTYCLKIIVRIAEKILVNLRFDALHCVSNHTWVKEIECFAHDIYKCIEISILGAPIAFK